MNKVTVEYFSKSKDMMSEITGNLVHASERIGRKGTRYLSFVKLNCDFKGKSTEMDFNTRRMTKASRELLLKTWDEMKVKA